MSSALFFSSLLWYPNSLDLVLEAHKRHPDLKFGLDLYVRFIRRSIKPSRLG